MCGIIFVRRYDGHGARKMITKRYEAQKARGTEGFGFITIVDGKVKNIVKAATESQIMSELKNNPSTEILFHHRTPTSTPNFAEAAHPMEVINPALDFNYYLVHNGVITNADDLKAKHEKLGFLYNTILENQWKSKYTKYEPDICFNDSEALAVELALYLEGKTEALGVTGSAAFICIQTDKDSNVVALFYGRGSNPLVLRKDKDATVMASEGEGDDIAAHTLYRFDYRTGITSETALDIGYKYTKLGYLPSGTYASKLKDEHDPYAGYDDYEDYRNADWRYDKDRKMYLPQRSGFTTPADVLAETARRVDEIEQNLQDGKGSYTADDIFEAEAVVNDLIAKIQVNEKLIRTFADAGLEERELEVREENETLKIELNEYQKIINHAAANAA